MSGYSTQLKIDKHDAIIDLLSMSTSFSRSVDEKGRPSSHVMGGQLNCNALITKDTYLLQQMVNNDDVLLKGTITMIDSGSSKKVHRIFKFKNAFIVNYSESFSVQGQSYSCSFTITAALVIVGDEATLVQRWPGLETDDKF
ncbi:type VI secretion system tube protein TssD [Spirosoma fluviale]|uniref:Uncharacterized protein n=1 Tax=Spirosoma fluviale TaxID=1597977 RepID=A0A286G4G2_9BACT|nr:type VI secretion system tube protein TssD [Spirosoma fluviale]SOD90039.1 hypothetical protein SAMN06269250_3278 [Spirosoma fluviale]